MNFKQRLRILFISFLAFVIGVLSPNIQTGLAASTIDLGSASNFVLLAGNGISNSGNSIVIGDMGTFPSTSFVNTGNINLTGTNYFGSAPTQTAKNDLASAFSAAGIGSATSTMTGDLGGLTLGPGIYKGSSAIFFITINGVLTLDAGNDPSAVFIFRGSRLTTADNISKVNLINGAQACNVFWKINDPVVQSFVTLGVGTTFRGTVLAEKDITVKEDTTIVGRLLTTTGKITTKSDRVYLPTCAQPSPSPSPSTTTSPTVSASPSPTLTVSPSPTLTVSPSPTLTVSPSPTLTVSPSPTSSVSSSACPALGPSVASCTSSSPSPSVSVSPSPTTSPTSLSPSPTASASASPTTSPSPSPSPSTTVSTSASPPTSPSPSVKPSPTSTTTHTSGPTPSPSMSISNSPSPSENPDKSASPTPRTHSTPKPKESKTGKKPQIPNKPVGSVATGGMN